MLYTSATTGVRLILLPSTQCSCCHPQHRAELIAPAQQQLSCWPWLAALHPMQLHCSSKQAPVCASQRTCRPGSPAERVAGGALATRCQHTVPPSTCSQYRAAVQTSRQYRNEAQHMLSTTCTKHWSRHCSRVAWWCCLRFPPEAFMDTLFLQVAGLDQGGSSPWTSCLPW